MREGCGAGTPPLAALLLQATADAGELASQIASFAEGAGASDAALADLTTAAGEYARAVDINIKMLRSLRELLSEQRVRRIAGAVVVHGALCARDLAALACASRAWRAAVGPHGAVRAALGREDADERVRGCEVVATAAAAARAGARADAHEGLEAVDAAAAEKTGPFDALLEALLRDGEARVRLEAVRALWVLGKGNVAPERAKAMHAALDGEALFTLEGHGSAVYSVRFSPDGKRLASGSWDMTVRLWDAETGACVRTLEGHRHTVRSVCFSPDGRQVASGNSDNTVRLWNVETGECVRTLEGHGATVRSVCFSPDGRMVASGSDDNTVRLWLLV